MKLVHAKLALAAALLCGVAALAQGVKVDEAKLLGKWVSAGGSGNQLEFVKGGVVRMTVRVGDKENTGEGTWKADGDKLTVTFKVRDKLFMDDLTVMKLDDTDLVTKDSNGKEDAFKRKK